MPSKLQFSGSWIALSAELAKTKTTKVFLPSSLHDFYWVPKKRAYQSVDYFLPDGMPVVWLLRFFTGKSVKRLYGPTIFLKCLRRFKSQKHIFLGSSQVLSLLKKKYPFASSINLPFAENAEEIITPKILRQLVKENADFIWVGVGSPKQVEIAHLLKGKLKKGNIMCVGAAFDFVAGVKSQAPQWIQVSGLEWLYRLLHEPKRLWKRYLVLSVQGFLNLLSFHPILPR